MRVSAILLVCLLFVLTGTTCFSASPLRIAIDIPYPPFADTDPKTGEFFGFDVDIARAVCKEMNKECVILAVPFDEIIPSIVAGTIDVGVAGMATTPEREKQVLFSDKYFRSSSLFIEVPGTVEGISREALQGKKIAVQNDTIQHGYLKETYGDIATIVPMQSFEDIARATLDKTVDVAFVEGLPAYYKLKQEEWSGLDLIGDPISFNKNSHIVVGLGNTALRDAINQAIQAIRANGEYDRINRKYFEFNIY